MGGTPETYYEILGIPGDAPDREIRRAYRSLARSLHPDICREAGAEDRFKRINEAYRVLSNPVERRRYDLMGHKRYLLFPGGSGNPPAACGTPDTRGSGDVFNLFFSEKAWGSERIFRPRSCTDILVRTAVTFGEAIHGCEKMIEVPHAFRCTSCGGTGSGTRKVSTCPGCAGTGSGGRGAGGDRIDLDPVPCRECGGRGRIPEEPCTLCDGWGVIRATRKVPVRIPPGIDSGMRIRKEGLGEGGDTGIPKGDLYVEVMVLPHERFVRKGEDLEVTLPISPARAVLGTTADVETFDGRVLRVEIPPGVQHDMTVRVAREGVRLQDRCGDLVVRIRVTTPEKTTAGERDLYRRLIRIEEERERGRNRGLIPRYLSKIRKGRN
jgi:molecular chaperone DnaJ